MEMMVGVIIFWNPYLKTDDTRLLIIYPIRIQNKFTWKVMLTIWLMCAREIQLNWKNVLQHFTHYRVIKRLYNNYYNSKFHTQRRRYRVANSARWFLKSKEAAESKPFFDHEGVIFSTPTYLSQNWRSDGHFEVLNRSKS